MSPAARADLPQVAQPSGALSPVIRRGSGRSLPRIAFSVRMRAVVVDGVVKLVDQGGGFIVRQVKVRHNPDIGPLRVLMNLAERHRAASPPGKVDSSLASLK
jgi:hypothetical protein